MNAVSIETIERMEKGGASQESINFARRTQNSMDPRDVAIHRGYINSYNPGDPWREPNNFVMHPTNYQFNVPGRPNTSPQYIGGMFSTLPGPVYINGPQIMFPSNTGPYINPYIQYR
jgi:hypothetical protein